MPEPGIVFAETELTDRLPDPLFLTVDPDIVTIEYQQLQDAGRDTTQLPIAVDSILATPDDPDFQSRANTVLDAGSTLPIVDDYPYTEPTALEEINSHTPTGPDVPTVQAASIAADAIHGGWLGACAGCLLGKPVQGWSRTRITEFLEASDQAPLNAYLHADVSDGIADRFAIHENLEPVDAFIDEVEGMPIDDDIDYVVLGLDALETHGLALEDIDIASTWLSSLPLFRTYTAERIAYRNLATGILPPDSATHRNPYREMIGAMIRADTWGFVALGDPATAAALAHRDARISHVKNGVYGAMWVAAMIAAAPHLESLDAVIDAGLAVIPANSRLTAAVDESREWWLQHEEYESVADRIHDRWDETQLYDWVHTLSNAQIITAALLASDGVFETGVCRAVETGFDTDSHAATIGSILGTYNGASALPTDWTDPLEDTLHTSLPGYGTVSISTLAERTTSLWTEVDSGTRT